MKRRVKICIDVRCLLDEPISGVGMYAYQLLMQYVRYDTEHEYILFFSGKKISNILQQLQSDLSDCDHITWHHLELPNKIINALWFFGFGPALDVLTTADVVWMLNFNFCAISSDAKLLITCHDISFVTIPAVYSPKGRFWHWLVGATRLYKRANKVLAVSKATASDLEHIGISKKNIHVVYPFIPEITVPASSKAPTSFPERPYFLYLGTLDPRKNTLGLLLAYQKYRAHVAHPRDLVLGGRLGWNSRVYYKKIMHSISSTPGVRYLGYVDEVQKNHLYSKARAFVFASVYEGFGFPPLEAMQTGCPVISSFSGSLPEVVGEAAYMIDPYNQQDLITALKLFDESDEVCKTYKELGQVRIEYWKQNTQKTKEKLDSILSLI